MRRRLFITLALLLTVPTIASATLLNCPGDCDGDGAVSINELILGVSIALGQGAIGDCAAFDTDADAAIAIQELVAGVSAALGGCATALTPTATGMATPTPTTTTAVDTPTATSMPTMPLDTPTETETAEPVPTRTRTPAMLCGASAPECLGTCPPRRICEATEAGGCQCVLINNQP